LVALVVVVMGQVLVLVLARQVVLILAAVVAAVMAALQIVDTPEDLVSSLSGSPIRELPLFQPE
jgi:hypothetical protein